MKERRTEMNIQITAEELQKMELVLLDEDLKEAFDLIEIFHKRLMEQMSKRPISHLDQQ